MSDPAAPGSSPRPDVPAGDRLDSWKEIAAYLRRDVTTVQRWEKREGMPVHRHVHDKAGSVYAFRTELDTWARSRHPGQGEGTPKGQRFSPAALESEEVIAGDVVDRAIQSSAGAARAAVASSPTHQVARFGLLILAGAVGMVGLTVWQARQRDSRTTPLADARFSQLTDFGGTAQAAAISRDGRFVAFLSDRDGRMDVWATQVGTGQFYNLTRDAARELVNPSIRTLGFSPDGTLVTFWARRLDAAGSSDIGIWAVPILGGRPRAYLDDVAEFDWSIDGGRLVYHTPGPGDPMFVSDSGQRPDARRIFSAPPGLHSHFVLWSPDQAFIYFVQGAVPDRMDIWRIRPTGGPPERITHHDSLVSHPVFLNARTLAYLATDSDGSGPWLHSLDIEQRIPRRMNVGIDRYTSLGASADGRRLVATRASPNGTLWRIPVTGGRVETAAARRISLTTGNGVFPRLGAGYLLYVSSIGPSDSIWRLQGDTSTELWSAPEARVIGAPAIARDGRHVAFSSKRKGQASLHVMNADGTNARILTGSLEVRGAPAWAPDGDSLTVAVVVNGVPRLFSVPLDGRAPAPLLEEYSVDPVWAPDGDVVVFSGPDVGTTLPIKAVTAAGAAYPLPPLTLSRGARHLTFLPGRRALVVLRGEIRHKNLWLIELDTGAERQLTDLGPGFDVRDFDIAPDGSEIVLEQVEERSDIVLLDVPER